jgi:hypothetical protein
MASDIGAAYWPETGKEIMTAIKVTGGNHDARPAGRALRIAGQKRTAPVE